MPQSQRAFVGFKSVSESNQFPSSQSCKSLARCCGNPTSSFVTGSLTLGLIRVVGSVLVLRPSHSLEVLVVVRVGKLQSVGRWTRRLPGSEPAQASSSPSQSLGARQAADRPFRRLPGELKRELASSWAGQAILAIQSCPAESLGPELGGGNTGY